MKATKAIIRQRVEDVLQIRLDGATAVDVRRYAAEKEAASEIPWTIAEGGQPVSERTIWRYIQQADRLMVECCRESRKRSLKRHLAQRRGLYARAVNGGDVRSALACLDSEAKLLDLFPSADARLLAEVDALKKQLAEIEAKDPLEAKDYGISRAAPSDRGATSADQTEIG